MRKKKPRFVEANLDVLQVRFGEVWEDFASIKNAADMSAAIARVNAEPTAYRIVRNQCGREVIYPPAR